MKSHIYFVGDERQQEVSELRMQEYRSASGFKVDVQTLKWRASDSESYIMVAETNGRLVSTMRGEIIDAQKLLEEKLECPWSFDLELQFPVLLLSRAATDSSMREHGLNLLLRSRFFDLARHYGIRHVVGTFVAGSPRERSLKEMGYQFFENTAGWQKSTYRSLAPVQVVVLDLERDYTRADEYCRSRVGKSFQEYAFEETFPEIKYVRSI